MEVGFFCGFQQWRHCLPAWVFLASLLLCSLGSVNSDDVGICDGVIKCLRRIICRRFLDSGDRTAIRVVLKEEERENGYSDPCSSSSSSIGKNIDDEEIDEENEVKSKLNNTSFDSAVDALEQALPIRREISNFYNGKSKSFASLGDAACTSIKEITKPENAYSRKHKNLLAYNLLCDNGRISLFRGGSGIGGGIAKRPTNSSRSTLALAVAMKNCESHADEDGPVTETNGRSEAKNTSPSSPLSPLPPAPWRSFSLADLQHCAVSASVVNSNFTFNW